MAFGTISGEILKIARKENDMSARWKIYSVSENQYSRSGIISNWLNIPFDTLSSAIAYANSEIIHSCGNPKCVGVYDTKDNKYVHIVGDRFLAQQYFA